MSEKLVIHRVSVNNQKEIQMEIDTTDIAKSIQG